MQDDLMVWKTLLGVCYSYWGLVSALLQNDTKEKRETAVTVILDYKEIVGDGSWCW